MFRNRVLWLIVFLTAVSSTVVSADGIVEKAQRAQKLIEEGQELEALDLMNEAVEIVWDASPLLVRNAVFVDSFSGYGLYAERLDGNQFKAGEKAVLYFELLGYGYGRSGVGSLQIELDLDFRIKRPGSDANRSFRSAGTLTQPVRYKNREFFMNFNLSLSDRMEPTSYILELRITDTNSDKSATFQVPFSIGE